MTYFLFSSGVFETSRIAHPPIVEKQSNDAALILGNDIFEDADRMPWANRLPFGEQDLLFLSIS